MVVLKTSPFYLQTLAKELAALPPELAALKAHVVARAAQRSALAGAVRELGALRAAHDGRQRELQVMMVSLVPP